MFTKPTPVSPLRSTHTARRNTHPYRPPRSEAHDPHQQSQPQTQTQTRSQTPIEIQQLERQRNAQKEAFLKEREALLERLWYLRSQLGLSQTAAACDMAQQAEVRTDESHSLG